MKKPKITAVSVRKFLTTLLVILIIAGVGGFYFGLQQVRSFGVDVSHDVADANASGKNIERLQELKVILDEREALILKADGIFSTEANYQSQALTDVQRYAAAYNLRILTTNFESKPTTPIANGHNFSITLQTPTNYEKLLQFLNAIEGNLPKMQIASITLSRAPTAKASDVTVGTITITISTK